MGLRFRARTLSPASNAGALAGSRRYDPERDCAGATISGARRGVALGADGSAATDPSSSAVTAPPFSSISRRAENHFS